MTLDDIAEEVGKVEEERDDSKDKKEHESTYSFDIEEYMRDMEEYDGDW
jgi:hypothetical protein